MTRIIFPTPLLAPLMFSYVYTLARHGLHQPTVMRGQCLCCFRGVAGIIIDLAACPMNIEDALDGMSPDCSTTLLLIKLEATYHSSEDIGSTLPFSPQILMEMVRMDSSKIKVCYLCCNDTSVLCQSCSLHPYRSLRLH